MLEAILTHHDYPVLTAAHGAQGVATFQQHASDISLVILDMMMPVMDGHQAMLAIREIRRDTKFIAMSGLGHTSPLLAEAGMLPPVILAKPFTADKVLAAVQQTLHSSPQAGTGES